MKMKKIIAFLIIPAVLCAAFFFWSNNHLTVSTIEVALHGLPKQFDGYKIAHISDLHNKNFGGRLIDMLYETEPDIIVVTGDVIDCHRTNRGVALEFFKNALSIAPVYYVSGNHENRVENYSDFSAHVEALGVKTAGGKSFTLERNGAEICLIGMEDLSFFGSSVLNENRLAFEHELSRLAEACQDKTTLLLSHRPELMDIYAACEIDLVFSGHAHGGQIRLPFIGGLYAPGQGFLPNYTAGIYESGQTSMIVSRGLGNSVFPLRIGNSPQIVLCELHN